MPAGPSAVEVMAERAGFEPTVLSHTAFRERHHQPLGHLSAGEDTKGPRRPATGPMVRGPVPAQRGRSSRGEQLLGLVAADAADDLEPPRRAPGAGRAGGPCRPPRRAWFGHGEDEASTSLSRSAPTHIAQGSSVEKIVASASRTRPSRRAASRRATITAWAVGSLVASTRSWARATIASSTTATARDRALAPRGREAAPRRAPRP